MSENPANGLTVQEMLLFASARHATLVRWQFQRTARLATPNIPETPWDQMLAEEFATVIADLKDFEDQLADSRS